MIHVKILAVVGSPKGKGSGYAAITEIERHMESMGQVEFEYLFLRDANLGLCRGCYGCVIRGEGTCPIDDDRAAIEKKLLAADGVILSSPVYVLNVSAPMKNFIDRFMYANHRPKFFRQKTLLVVNSISGAGTGQALAPLKMALGGSRNVGALSVVTQPWEVTERIRRQNEKALKDSAGKLYRACLETKLPDPGFRECLKFGIMKAIYTEWKDHMELDYEYFRGREYFYPAKIGRFSRLATGTLASAIVALMKRSWA